LFKETPINKAAQSNTTPFCHAYVDGIYHDVEYTTLWHHYVVNHTLVPTEHYHVYERSKNVSHGTSATDVFSLGTHEIGETTFGM